MVSEERDKINGNVMRFERVYHHVPLAEYRVGPFRGYWFLPVVMVDFEWVFYNWEKYVQGRDPMDAFRE